MKLKLYRFEEDLAKRLKNPKFKKAWDESGAEYLLAESLIKKRLAQKISQRALAKKLKTSQAAISRVESMNGNPSLSFLKRLATALNSKLVLGFK